jgi:hypothetical protein
MKIALDMWSSQAGFKNHSHRGIGYFDHPIVPKFIRKPVSAVRRYSEQRNLFNYLKHSIGAVAMIDPE